MDEIRLCIHNEYGLEMQLDRLSLEAKVFNAVKFLVIRHGNKLAVQSFLLLMQLLRSLQDVGQSILGFGLWCGRVRG